MALQIEVFLWGTKVGDLGYKDQPTINQPVTIFEFTTEIVKANIEISPLLMSSKAQQHTFPEISFRTFKGLPGIFADSLPDKFGTQLIDIYMAEKGVPLNQVTSLDRLMYIGDRGMGALEYQPSEIKTEKNDLQILDLKMLNNLAGLVNKNKKELSKKLESTTDHQQALKFIRVSSSAGGARSKALIATTPDGQLKDGTIDHGIDHDYWLLKFDADNNHDRDSNDPKGMPKVEYIYSLIAKSCGIDMPRTDYIKDDNNFHFMIERFDRVKQKGKLEKLHFVSWCGISHAHRDITGAYSYEQLALVCKELSLGSDALKEIFKRCVFNIVGRNQDDHTKNFGFLMSKDLVWHLAPAFDLTYSFDPTGKWTSTHQIRLNRKQTDFVRSDLLAFATQCNLTAVQGSRIIDKIISEFKNFEQLANKYKVPLHLTKTISKNLRRKCLLTTS